MGCTSSQPVDSSPDLLLPVEGMDELSPEHNKTLKTWRVTTYTGNIRFAATDANVFISLHFEGGDWSQEYLLEKLSHDHGYFERGQENVFFIREPKHEVIDKIRVRHDNTGAGAAWYLEKIELQSYFNYVQYDFVANQWLDADSGDKAILRELPRTGIHPPLESSLAGYVKQKSKFKTGDLILFSSHTFWAAGTKYWTESPFSHTGVLYETNGRWISFESTDDLDPVDFYPTKSPPWSGVHAFDFDERIASYFGDVYHLPLKNPLTDAQKQTLWRFLAAHRGRRTKFAYRDLFGAGMDWFDGIGLTLNRESYESMICSTFVGAAMKEIGLLPKSANANELTPADVPKFTFVQKPFPMKIIISNRSLPLGLRSSLDTGDILLISTEHSPLNLKKKSDRTRWNHCAVIVRFTAGQDESLHVFNAANGRPELVPLEELLLDKRIVSIALRRFDFERTDAMRAEAKRFAEQELKVSSNEKNRDAIRVAQLLDSMEIFNARAAPATFSVFDFTSEGQDVKFESALAKGKLYKEIFIKN